MSAANLYPENESAWHWYIPALFKDQAWQKTSSQCLLPSYSPSWWEKNRAVFLPFFYLTQIQLESVLETASLLSFRAVGTPWEADESKQWESNSLCRCKYRLWQYSLLCGVCLFFSEEVMENKLALNILLQRYYLKINTNFKPFVLIVGYFFPHTNAIPKINLGQNFIFRKTSCAELW